MGLSNVSPYFFNFLQNENFPKVNIFNTFPQPVYFSISNVISQNPSQTKNPRKPLNPLVKTIYIVYNI